MADHVVGGVLFQAVQHTVVLIKGVQHGGRHRALAQCHGADVVDFLQRRLNVDAQNVNLVGIAQKLAECPRAGIELFRQAKGAVPFHSGAQQGVLGRVVHIVADAALVKQHLHAEGGVADRLRINKGVVPAQLLKAAHIVQQAAQPCQIDILRRQAQAAGNAGAERGHAVGVVNFQLYFRVGGIVVCGVGGKGPLRTDAVDFHSYHFPALIVAYLLATILIKIYPRRTTFSYKWFKNP